MITCILENGDKPGFRHIVVGAVIVKDNKVLLEKRGTFKGRPILESGKWAIVGGFLDRGETIEEGLKREVFEETNLKVEDLKLLHVNDNPKRPNDNNRQNVSIVFIATPLTDELIETEEAPELRWFDLDRLPAKEEFAFDHYDELTLYKKHLKYNLPLPIIGKPF